MPAVMYLIYYDQADIGGRLFHDVSLARVHLVLTTNNTAGYRPNERNFIKSICHDWKQWCTNPSIGAGDFDEIKIYPSGVEIATECQI